MLKLGTKAPDFTLYDSNGVEVGLNSFRGRSVVLYFYPRDNTPGCTLEAADFSRKHSDFDQRQAVVVGISTDSVQSHRAFCDSHDLSVTLLSDPYHEVIEQYGAWQEKSKYGKTYMGTVRTTYLIDPGGTIRHVWENVSPQGHADQVLSALDALVFEEVKHGAS